MSFVDFDKVKANSGGDQELLHELINMGMERINVSLTEMHASVNNRDWESLSRSIHKLRPILCYAGIDAFNEELLALERQAKEQTGLAEVPARIDIIAENMRLARCELERLLSELRK